jgi:hypothetical protein
VRRAGCIWGLTLIVCLLAPSFAGAHTVSIKDGNDVPGALDIRSAGVGHDGRYVKHTITTFDPWSLKDIDINRSPLNYLGVGFNLSGDSSFDRYVVFVDIRGNLRAFWITPRGRILNRFRASRPNGKSVSVRVPRDYLVSGGGYEWSALAVFAIRGHRHVDWAPDGTSLLHDLLPPKINVGLTYDTSTYTSATTTVPIDFTLNDHTESAGVDWLLQRRQAGSSVWETADSGEGVGPQTAHIVGEDGANYLVRLLARDRQGNTTRSSSWGLSFPIDDANAFFDSAYTGSWSTTTLGDPYLGTLHSTSTAGDSFTFTFNVTHADTRMAWIGPGSPNGGGSATITFDAYPPYGVSQSLGNFDHGRIWEGTGLALGMHTITITNVSGTIAIDGFVLD